MYINYLFANYFFFIFLISPFSFFFFNFNLEIIIALNFAIVFSVLYYFTGDSLKLTVKSDIKQSTVLLIQKFRFEKKIVKLFLLMVDFFYDYSWLYKVYKVYFISNLIKPILVFEVFLYSCVSKKNISFVHRILVFIYKLIQNSYILLGNVKVNKQRLWQKGFRQWIVWDYNQHLWPSWMFKFQIMDSNVVEYFEVPEYLGLFLDGINAFSSDHCVFGAMLSKKEISRSYKKAVLGWCFTYSYLHKITLPEILLFWATLMPVYFHLCKLQAQYPLLPVL